MNSTLLGIILLIFHECPLKTCPIQPKASTHLRGRSFIFFTFIYVLLEEGKGCRQETGQPHSVPNVTSGAQAVPPLLGSNLEYLRVWPSLPTQLVISQTALRDSKGSCCLRKMSALRKRHLTKMKPHYTLEGRAPLESQLSG